MENGTARLGVYGPPVGSPRFEWQLQSKQNSATCRLQLETDIATPQVTCQINEFLNVTFSPVELVLFDGADETSGSERRGRHVVDLWDGVRFYWLGLINQTSMSYNTSVTARSCSHAQHDML